MTWGLAVTLLAAAALGSLSTSAVSVPPQVTEIVATRCYADLPGGRQLALPYVVANFESCVAAVRACPGSSGAETHYTSPGPTALDLRKASICTVRDGATNRPGNDAPPGPSRQPSATPSPARPPTLAPRPDRPANLAPITRILRSGPRDSGPYDNWSPWYEICSERLPEGYAISSFEFRLEGDRDCTGWAHCELSKNSPDEVCYRFQMQGRTEGSIGWSGARIGSHQGIRSSEGVLTVTASNVVQRFRQGASAARSGGVTFVPPVPPQSLFQPAGECAAIPSRTRGSGALITQAERCQVWNAQGQLPRGLAACLAAREGNPC